MSRHERAQSGNAIVEVAVLGTLIFGVLVQVIVLFGALHRATLATSAAARELGRAVVLASSTDDAGRRASLVVSQATADYGLPQGSLHPRVSGRVVRGAHLRVTVETDVPVVELPFLGSVVPSLSVPVEATHVVQVDLYRSFG